jgi:hypothetical protein
MNDLAKYIKQWIDELGTSGQWLYKRAGVTSSSYSTMLAGKIPETKNLRKLARAMGVPTARLLLLARHIDKEDLIVKDVAGEYEEVLSLWSQLPAERRSDLLAIARLWLQREVPNSR